MHKLMTVLLTASILAITIPARAGDVPTRSGSILTNVSSTAQTYTVPAFNNGRVASVQFVNASGTNDTLTVTHTIPVTASITQTNTLASVPLLANATYSTTFALTNAFVVPGDNLNFQTGSVTGNVIVTRIVSTP